jgi:hypothetical protein
VVSGGTLNGKTARDWKAASYSNRLATSADLVAKAGNPSSMQDMKAKSTQVEACVSEVVNDPKIQKLAVNELAAGCFILLGYRR